MKWSSLSTDLNPIEKFWSNLKRYLDVCDENSKQKMNCGDNSARIS